MNRKLIVIGATLLALGSVSACTPQQIADAVTSRVDAAVSDPTETTETPPLTLPASLPSTIIHGGPGPETGGEICMSGIRPTAEQDRPNLAVRLSPNSGALYCFLYFPGDTLTFLPARP